VRALRAWLPKSLFGRLALVQILAGALVAAGFVVVLEVSHGDYHTGLAQRQNLLLAERVLEDFGATWRRNPRNAEGINETLRRIGRMNPYVDLYWLSDSGTIIASSVPTARLRINRLDIAPLLALASGADGRLPMLATDPADPARQKAFAVAKASSGAEGGSYFLYLVLVDDDAHVFTRRAWASTFRQALAMVVGVIALALISALVILRVILKRFRQLSDAMRRFGRGEFAEWEPVDAVPARPGASELDRMSDDFNTMAGRIVTLLRELKDDERLMREMFANISHDLRTPLTIIQGNLEILDQRGGSLSSAERRAMVQTVLQEVRRLGGLVEGVFELAKLRSPHYRIRAETLSLGEFLHDLAAKFRAAAASRGLALEVMTANAHVFAVADVVLLERIMDNLIGNALQHAAGASAIRIGLRDVGDGLEVSVRDDGSGFKSGLPQQDPSEYAGARPGGGLGLQIVRTMLALHGAALVIETAPGKGTTCRFVLAKAGAALRCDQAEVVPGSGDQVMPAAAEMQ